MNKTCLVLLGLCTVFLSASQASQHYATGIPYVLVNGILVVQKGERTGAKAGHALRHSGSKS